MTWLQTLQSYFPVLPLPAPNTVSHALRLAPHNTSILISGLDSVGRSTLLKSQIARHGEHDVVATYDSPRRYEPRRGPYSEDTTLTYGRRSWRKEVKVRSYDVGSCSPDYWKEFWKKGFRAADAIVWVVSSVDAERLLESLYEAKYYLLISEEEEGKGMGKGKKRPLLILANKQGLRGTCEQFITPDVIEDFFRKLASDAQSASSEKAGENLKSDLSRVLKDRPWRVVGTDAVSGEGVYDAFEWLGRQLEGRGEAAVGEEQVKKEESKPEKTSTALKECLVMERPG